MKLFVVRILSQKDTVHVLPTCFLENDDNHDDNDDANDNNNNNNVISVLNYFGPE
jgi:hypothetical protein